MGLRRRMARPSEFKPAFDPAALQSWLLGDRGLSTGYVDQIQRALAQLGELGLDLGEILAGPRRARAAAAPILEHQRTAGSLAMLRRFQKALNLVARFQVMRGHDAYRSVKWELHPERRAAVQPYDVQDVEDLLVRDVKTFRELRDLAAQHVLFWTGKRKREVWSLLVEDLDVATRTWLLRNPAKGGPQELLLLPAPLVDGRGALMAYLRARRRRAGGRGRVWIQDAGTELTLAGFSNLTWRLRRAGHDVNFHRWRHTHLTFLDDHDVALQDIQIRANHADPRTTMRYVHGNPHKHAHQLRGVPGMENHPLARDPRALWRPLLKALGAQPK